MVLTPYWKISEKCYFNYHLFELLITLEADISDSGFQNTSESEVLQQETRMSFALLN